MKYVVKNIKWKDHDLLLVCLSAVSPYYYDDLIVTDPHFKGRGSVIVDFLIMNGHGDKRYAVFDYCDGMIDYNSGRYIAVSDEVMRLSTEILKSNSLNLRFSPFASEFAQYLINGDTFVKSCSGNN